MAEETGQYNWIIKAARVAMIVTVSLAGVALIPTAVIGVMATSEAGSMVALVPWAAAAACEIGVVVWALVMYGLVRVIVANAESVQLMAMRMDDVESLMADQVQCGKDLVDLGKLSDQAKSLVFREGEIEAFQEAIHADLISQDYKSAERLIESIETKFGYVEEAARLRSEVEATRKATLDEKIDAAIGRIMKATERLDWARASREAKRLMQLFPDNPKVASLTERIQTAQMQRKRDLLQSYGEAVRKNDVDVSIKMLKELDMYLTPQEAGALAESARGIFKAKLHNLGVQFAIRVTDEQWSGAVGVGEEIIRGYPNSRMAHEVHEKLPTLRAKAALQAQQSNKAHSAQ